MKHLKISLKILLVMGVLILLSTGLATKLVSSMSTVNDQSTIIAENWLPSVVATSEINTDTSDFRLQQCNHVGTTDAAVMKDAESAMDAIISKIAKERAEYEKMISSDEEQKLYNEFSASWKKYMDTHSQFLKLSQTNMNDEAKKILYGDSMEEFNKASALLVKLVYLNKKGADDASATGDVIYDDQRTLAIAGIAVLILLAGGCVFVLTRAVATPIVGITKYMDILSGGDLTQDVPAKERRDEIGQMAGSIQIFKDGLLRAKELEAEAERERAAKEARQQKIDAATQRFELSMADIVKIVSAASTELQASAESLAAAAEETSVQSNAVAAASTEASTNIQTVAASSEELTASIGEISNQVQLSNTVVGDAVEKSQGAILSIQKLVQSAQKIGEVTSVINDISNQTNLLALLL